MHNKTLELELELNTELKTEDHGSSLFWLRPVQRIGYDFNILFNNIPLYDQKKLSMNLENREFGMKLVSPHT